MDAWFVLGKWLESVSECVGRGKGLKGVHFRADGVCEVSA